MLIYAGRNEDKSLIADTYNSEGRRATKKVTTNGSVTLHQRYIYRGYLQIACCDLTRSGHPCLWLLTWDPTQTVATRPLAIRKVGNWFAYGWDLTKNICEVYQNNGYIGVAYSYSPFGKATANGNIKQAIQWSSEHIDDELKLNYYNYRYYNANIGNWNRRDPLISKSTAKNPYSYNTPTLYTDKLGLYTLIDATKAIRYYQHDEFMFVIEESNNYIGNISKCSCNCAFIWIHGFNTSLEEAKIRFQRVEREYKSRNGNCQVYGFAWNGASGMLNFDAAQEAARITGRKILSKFLTDLINACPKTRIHMGTHSLGALVALEALMSIDAKINNVVLVNAAIDNKSLQRGERCEDASNKADTITLAISNEDDVLEFAYPLSEFDSAAGETGSENPQKLPDNVKEEDYTNDFGDDHGAVYDNEKNKNFWDNMKDKIN